MQGKDDNNKAAPEEHETAHSNIEAAKNIVDRNVDQVLLVVNKLDSFSDQIIDPAIKSNIKGCLTNLMELISFADLVNQHLTKSTSYIDEFCKEHQIDPKNIRKKSKIGETNLKAGPSSTSKGGMSQDQIDNLMKD
jgi:hypothetical protein